MVRTVVVDRAAAGGLLVSPQGYREAEGVLVQGLPVAGGMLDLHIGAPEQGLRALIADVDDAAWWVPFVFGDDVLTALVDLAADPDASARVVAVAPRDVELAETARRLVYGLWLRRWLPPAVYPAPVAEWLLDSELGALAARGEVLFGGDEIAVALLQGTQARLSAELEHVLATTEASALAAAFVPGTVAGVVQRAAFAAVDLLEPDAPGAAGLAASVAAVRDAVRDAVRGTMRAESHQATPPAAGAGADADADAGLDALSASLEDLRAAIDDGRQSEYALAAGDSFAGMFTETSAGSEPVDWTAVHPRQLSADSDALTWEFDTGGEEAVLVVVASAPVAEVSVPIEPGELYARIEMDGEVYAAAFEADPAGERHVARWIVPSGRAAAAPLVTVYSDLYSSGGRVAASAEEIDVVRATVMAVATRRAADVRNGTAAVAPYAFERVAAGLDATGTYATGTDAS